MTTRADIQNADLMKEYVQSLLAQNGFELEAKRLDGATIQCVGTAYSVASILRAMHSVQTAPIEVTNAKRQLLRQLDAIQA